MKFKSDAVRVELSEAEPKVVAIALYADWWSMIEFGHQLIVTDVSRSQAEYDAIYAEAVLRGNYWTDGGGIRHYAGPMPHLSDPVRKLKCRAVDLGVRHSGFMEEERLLRSEAILLADRVNAYWPRRDGKRTAMYHDVGQGPHVHLQAEI